MRISRIRLGEAGPPPTPTYKVMVGNKEVTQIKVGTKTVTKVYVGTKRVF